MNDLVEVEHCLDKLIDKHIRRFWQKNVKLKRLRARV